MKSPWSPDKDAKGADPNNPPKSNPIPGSKVRMYEYEWGQMGGTDVVECEVIAKHTDGTMTIKFWDYNVEDWEVRRVKSDTVRAIYEPAPLGKVRAVVYCPKDCPHNLAFDMTKILIVPEGAQTLKCANCTTVLGYIEP